MKELLFPKPTKSNRRPVFTKVEPSEEFCRHFGEGGGSIVADCQFCGRTHYDYTSSHNMDEGEYEDLERKRRSEPNRYFSRNHTVWHTSVGDLQVVLGCPCNGLAILEKFIWGARHRIADYFEARAKVEMDHAKSSTAAAAKAKKAVNAE